MIDEPKTLAEKYRPIGAVTGGHMVTKPIEFKEITGVCLDIPTLLKRAKSEKQQADADYEELQKILDLNEYETPLMFRLVSNDKKKE